MDRFLIPPAARFLIDAVSIVERVVGVWAWSTIWRTFLSDNIRWVAAPVRRANSAAQSIGRRGA